MPTPIFTVDELTTPVTKEQVNDSIYRVLAAIGIDAKRWKPAAVVNTAIAGVSVVLAALSKLQANIARSGFLRLSSDDWLTLVAHYVYGVDRIPASPASGFLTLVNGGGGVYSFDAGDLIALNPTSGETYRNTSAFVLTAIGSPGAATSVSILATESGASTTSSPATITALVTPLTGVSCSNPTALVGVDAETDDELRARCSEGLGARSPMGPWDAYVFAVRNAVRADGSNLGITRAWINKDGYGAVALYVATASGAVTPDELGVAAAAIAVGATPVGISATVIGATPIPTAISYEIWMYENDLTDDQVKRAISDRLTAYVSKLPLGLGPLAGAGVGNVVYHEALVALIFGTLNEIFHVVVSAPASNVVLDPTNVLTIDGAPTCLGVNRQPRPDHVSGI